MQISNLKFTLIVCFVILTLQTAFVLAPLYILHTFNMVLRPLIYIVLTVMLYTFLGIDERPVRKAYEANMIAVFSIILFGIVFIVLVFMFGAGMNIMVLNLDIVLRNMWEYGLIVILSELIRFKIIKTTNLRNRVKVVLMIAIILAYGQMNAIHMLINGRVVVWSIFFESIFTPLMISGIVSYIAIKGSFISVISVSFVYTMASYLLPILPNISPIAMSLVISGLIFISAVIYRFAINDKKHNERIREKQLERHAKKSFLNFIASILLLSVFVAFFIGLFPLYPVVILTHSMTGTFNRGSLVFVEKVPNNEAINRVSEEDVIHFIGHNGLRYIHRVIEFYYDINGKRLYITQGDASELVDPFPVPQDDILGITRGFLPLIGYIYIFFNAIIDEFT